MCLGLAYEKTGTLLVPMIMHAVFNAVSVATIMFLL
jgi:membrane protease YdiL (CAAX protease family)